MTVRQEFKFTSDSGEPVLNITQWASTKLPTEEYLRFQQAVSRQLALRQDYIDSGLLVVDKTDNSQHSYIWRDEEAAKNGKPWDDEWLTFWNRYLEENKITFNIEEKKE
jgi:hypothetical protein